MPDEFEPPAVRPNINNAAVKKHLLTLSKLKRNGLFTRVSGDTLNVADAQVRLAVEAVLANYDERLSVENYGPTLVQPKTVRELFDRMAKSKGLKNFKFHPTMLVEVDRSLRKWCSGRMHSTPSVGKTL